jgi:pimeloyl-ACP methyl ester carboxylesterase
VRVTTATETHTDQAIEVAGLALRYRKRGAGAPIVVLHHSTGNPGWIPFYERLAARSTVYVPDMPGYGQSARPEWAREPRDLAILLLQAMRTLGLPSATVVGLGFGGFVAAEMATMCQERIARLVLVGAPGLQPRDGEILDQMMVDFHEYVMAGFRDEETFRHAFGDEARRTWKELWDESREMTARLTWKPYMFSRRLAPLLREVRTPTLVLHGAEDAIVPVDVARQYAEVLPNAKLEVLPDRGHLIEHESPDALSERIAAFALAG